MHESTCNESTLTAGRAHGEALQSSRNRWRTAAMATGLLLLGVVLGGWNQAGSSLQSVVLDASQSSGRWSSTLLGVDSTGKVFYLDTSTPKAAWKPYKYSP